MNKLGAQPDKALMAQTTEEQHFLDKRNQHQLPNCPSTLFDLNTFQPSTNHKDLLKPSRPRPTKIDIIRGRGFLVNLMSEMDIINIRYPALNSLSANSNEQQPMSKYRKNRYPVDVTGQAALRILHQTSENMRLLREVDFLVKRNACWKAAPEEFIVSEPQPGLEEAVTDVAEEEEEALNTVTYSVPEDILEIEAILLSPNRRYARVLWW